MLVKRLLQFFLVYAVGIIFLLSIKYFLHLSDYVIPGFTELYRVFQENGIRYGWNVLNTFAVAVVGQMFSILLAFSVGIIGRQATWFGSFVKVAAYNIQAYPIVAIAPIIFILLGDGFLSRLIIGGMICYFPLLLSVVGVLSQPVEDVEHFYVVTGKMRWQLEVKIRCFENLNKLITVIAGSATLAMAGTIVAEFISADQGIGYSIRVALYQSELAKILVALFLIGVVLSVYQGGLEALGTWVQRRWTFTEKG